MGKLHLVQTHSPGSLSPERVTNGTTPRVDFLRRAADGMNAIAKWHKKTIQAKCRAFSEVVGGSGGGSAGSSYPWPVYFRTGENTVGLRIWLGIVDTDFAATSPSIDLIVRLAADASIVSQKSVYYNGRDEPTSGFEIPNRTNIVIVNLTGLSANTEYYLDNAVQDGLRLAFLTVHEAADTQADDAVDGIVDPTKFVTEGPIYDEHVEDLLEAGDQHWRHGGCHYLTWNPDYIEETVVVSATTYTNVIDGATTTYSAATLGVTLAAEYHGHAATAAAGPGVRIAVAAARTAGAGSLSVRLYNGTDSIEITGITTGGVGGWYVADSNIPDGIEKWDVQAKVSAGGTTFNLAAVCVFAYEAGP